MCHQGRTDPHCPTKSIIQAPQEEPATPGDVNTVDEVLENISSESDRKKTEEDEHVCVCGCVWVHIWVLLLVRVLGVITIACRCPLWTAFMRPLWEVPRLRAIPPHYRQVP